MSKKLMVFVLVFVMTMVFSVTYAAATLPQGTAGFLESFDQMATGNFTGGNGFAGYTYINGEVSIAEDPDSMNKSLKLVDNDFVTGSEYRFGVAVTKDGITGMNGKVVFETKYKIKKLDGYIPNYNIELYSGNQKISRFLQYSSRSYGIKTLSDDNANNYLIPGGTTGPEVPIDQWITIKMEIDTTKKTYDLSVQTDSLKTYTGVIDSQATLDKSTGTFKKIGIPLYSAYTGTDITKILIYSNNYKGEMYFDYVSMYKLPDSPMVTMTAPSEVNGSSEFYVDVGLKNVNDIKAEDITMNYDTNTFEFMGAEGSVADPAYNTVVSAVYNNTDMGNVRVILSNPGVGNVLNGEGQILKVRFKAKNVSAAGAINVTGAAIADSMGNETIVDILASTVVTIWDKSALQQLVINSTDAYNGAQEGVENGMFVTGMLSTLKAELQQAISSAEIILNKSNPTSQEVNEAFNNLTVALNQFESKRIKPETGDINNSQGISIGDVAIAAGFYGKLSTDADWSIAVVADFNEDQKVDMFDIEFISKRVMLLN